MQLDVKQLNNALSLQLKNKQMSPPKNDFLLVENLSHLLQLIPNSSCNSIHELAKNGHTLWVKAPNP